MSTLTRFEIAKIIGIRATQLENGATPQVDITGLDDAYSIAQREFDQQRIPFLVKRKYPEGKIVEISPNK